MKTQPTAMHPQKLIVSWSVLKELLPLMTLGSIDAAGSPTQTRTLKRIYPKLKQIMEGNND